MAVAVSPQNLEDITAVLQQAWKLPMAGGTEKQIAWAKNMRHEFLAEKLDWGFTSYARRHANNPNWREEVSTKIVERIGKVSNAIFWIENRSALSATKVGQDVIDLLSAKK